jgi:hypothetical protein
VPPAKPSEAATAQHARFLETAHALGCDEDEAAFDEKLKGIAKAKPTGECTTPADAKE